jgi:hypothetical protein
MKPQVQPERTIERKRREALALKANMKRRKAQVQEKTQKDPENPKTN